MVVIDKGAFNKRVWSKAVFNKDYLLIYGPFNEENSSEVIGEDCLKITKKEINIEDACFIFNIPDDNININVKVKILKMYRIWFKLNNRFQEIVYFCEETYTEDKNAILEFIEQVKGK